MLLMAPMVSEIMEPVVDLLDRMELMGEKNADFRRIDSQPRVGRII